nr:unnamed protein product [Spirometra erinaceieuropaei]
MKTGAATYGAIRVADGREDHNSMGPLTRDILPTLSTNMRVDFLGHLRTKCTNHPTTATAASTTVPTLTRAPTTTLPTLTTVAPNPCSPSPSNIATSIISASITTTTINTTIGQNAPDTPSTTNTYTIITPPPTSSDVESVPNCPHCDSTFNPCIGLVVHLRVDRTVSGAPDLFRDDSATHYRGPPVKFQFKSDFRPRFFKARTVPYAVAPKVEEELDRLQKADIIEPVQYSKWAAPIVPLLKSDGSVRICGDYKLKINSATKLNPYPFSRIKDLTWRSTKSSCFYKTNTMKWRIVLDPPKSFSSEVLSQDVLHVRQDNLRPGEGHTNGFAYFGIHRRGGPATVRIAGLPTPHTEVLIRYVDGTFVVIDRDQLLTSKKHLNTFFPHIQFTMEEEENNQLALLCVLVPKRTAVSRKTRLPNYNTSDGS